MKNKQEQYIHCQTQWKAILMEMEEITQTLPFNCPKQYNEEEINKWNKQINDFINRLQDLKYYSLRLLLIPFNTNEEN